MKLIQRNYVENMAAVEFCSNASSKKCGHDKLTTPHILKQLHLNGNQ